MTTSDPRLSRKALIGFFWGATCLLWMILSMFMESTILKSILGPPLLFAFIGTPVLGAMALSDIRGSSGRIQGRRLAFVTVMLFPTLLLSGLLFAGVMFTARQIQPQETTTGMAVAVSAWLIACLVIDIPLLTWVWRKIRPASTLGTRPSGQSLSENYGTATAEIVHDVFARDSVTISVERLERGDLPNICMVCGEPANRRASHQFSH